MQTVDLVARLEKILSPADLRLSGAALYRRLAPVLRSAGRIERRPFTRVEGDTQMLILRIETHSPDATMLLVFAAEGRVRARSVPFDEGWSGWAGRWHRSGNGLIGMLRLGGASADALLVLRFRQVERAWRLVEAAQPVNDIVDYRFASTKGFRLRLITREDAFRVLAQPHAGPLQLAERIWTADPRLRQARFRILRTPVDALDRFADAVLSGRLKEARRWCAPGTFAQAAAVVERSAHGSRLTVSSPPNLYGDGERHLGFGRPGDEGDVRIFFEFAPYHGRWRIVGFCRPGEFPKPLGSG